MFKGIDCVQHIQIKNKDKDAVLIQYKYIHALENHSGGIFRHTRTYVQYYYTTLAVDPSI